MLGQKDLAQHYQDNFALIQVHKYSLSEIENMFPYELEIYIDMLKEYLKKNPYG